MNNFSVKIVFADANMPATNEDAPSVELARSALGSLLRRYAGVRNGYVFHPDGSKDVYTPYGSFIFAIHPES